MLVTQLQCVNNHLLSDPTSDMGLTPMVILWCCSTVYKSRMHHNTKVSYCTRVIPRCKQL